MSVSGAEWHAATWGASQVCGAQTQKSSDKSAERQQTSELLLKYFSSINPAYLHRN